MAEEKKAIKIKFPEFDNNTENPYAEEMNKVIDTNLSDATTTRTLKSITENLTKALKSKYGIKDKEELKTKVNELLKLHGIAPENFDPLSFISKQVFGNLQSVNDVSIDDNANKTDTNMTGVCVESFLPYQKLAGYDYLYQTIKDLYGKEEAKKCTADMYDFSLFLNDSTKILIPYSYYGHTPIIVRFNESEIKFLTLKKLFDMFETSATFDSDHDLYIVNGENVKNNLYIGTGTSDGVSKKIAFQSQFRKNRLLQLPSITTKIEVWDGVRGWQQVTKILKHKNEKEKKFYLYQIEDGSFAFVTSDHPVILSDKTEIKAEELKEGDEVLVETKELPNVLQNIEIPKELAYFTGFLIGDGNYTSAGIDYDKRYNTNTQAISFRKGMSGINGITIYQNDIENSYIKKVAQEVFGKNFFKYDLKNDKNRKLGLSSLDYTYLISGFFGFTYKENSFTKHLPENILNWTIESKEALLAGIIDSDGTVHDNHCSIRLVSMAVINELYDSLKDLPGIKGLRKCLKTDKNDSTKFIFELYFRILPESNLISLSQKVKNEFDIAPELFKYDEKLNRNNINGKKVVKIVSFDYDSVADTRFLKQEIEYVYDITTTSGTFYANSMTQHNCYCIDASKIITEGRNFGQVHSSPAHRISTYISVLGDTIREMSFNVAGALAVGTFFMDICHLAIYRERIALDDLRNDKKIRKAMSNHFQQFIHTVNHYSRNAVESPFTNVSLFDRNKLEGLIADDNYGWYFPKKAAACEDNNIDDTKEAWKNFVLDYIEELQEIYIDVFDAGDPLRGGLQFPFPVTTVNFGTTKDENGKNELTYEDNKLLDYLTKNADISRYNIYASEGSKVASCCRLLSDSDFLAYAGGVNSFGGSQVSLGSHRVITINFARCAYEAESYDDFKKIISERVARMGKILKAHKILILKLEELGKQPWISNGWIDVTHLFSTFGCVGYVEADHILKFKFDHVDFDYMKDFLIFFNEECKKVADQENIVFNIEAIPAEGAAPKLAKADKLIFADKNGDYLYE